MGRLFVIGFFGFALLSALVIPTVPAFAKKTKLDKYHQVGDSRYVYLRQGQPTKGYQTMQEYNNSQRSR